MRMHQCRGLLCAGQPLMNVASPLAQLPSQSPPTPLKKSSQSVRGLGSLTAPSRAASVRAHSSRRPTVTSLLPQRPQQEQQAQQGEQQEASSSTSSIGSSSSSSRVPAAVVAAGSWPLFLGSVLGFCFTSEWIFYGACWWRGNRLRGCEGRPHSGVVGVSNVVDIRAHIRVTPARILRIFQG